MNKTGKKIIILGTSHPFRGGLAAYNERLAREFIKEGNQVSVYTFKLQYPGFLFPGKTQYADWEAPKDLNIKIAVNSINPFNWLKIGREIKKQKPDVLLIKYWLPFMAPCFGTIARLSKKNGVTKVISILDNIIPHEKRPGDTLFSKYFVKPVDGFVAMSDAVMNDLGQFDTVKPRTFCPHPLFDNFGELIGKQDAVKQLGLDPDNNYLLFFGFIRAYKGLDLIIEAMSDDRIRKMPVKLVVAGEFYEDGEKYKQQISDLNLSDRVVLKTDFIPDSEVGGYFCAADLVVQPYKSATQSGVTQIGYHFEKPMLVTDVGGLKEIIPDGKVGYVVTPDQKAIADSIVDFYENQREKSFILNAKKEKQKYLWSRMTTAIYELYEKVKP
ncbi:glycosyltransferase [Saccharicrinis sp. FJH54]|uniref:glycosyltransferase n=1 Tax=Saccharicrinis sp. FJH54 TaxID=3344665 RepID=UPI0035D3F20B